MAGNGGPALSSGYCHDFRACLPLSRRGLALAPALAAWPGCAVARSSRHAAARPPRSRRRPRSRRPQAAGASRPRRAAGPAGRAAPGSDRSRAAAVFRTGINFVRVDVIVTDNKGNPVADLKQSRLRSHRGRQAAEDRNLQAHQARRRPSAGQASRRARSAPTTDEERRRRAKTCGCSRSSSTTTTCAAAPAWRCASRSRSSSEPARCRSNWSASCIRSTPFSAVRMTRNHRRSCAALQQFNGRKFDYKPRNQFEEKLRALPDRDRRAHPQPGVAVGAPRRSSCTGSLKEGRKALILVSEGYTNCLPPQMRNPIAQMPGLGNPNAATRWPA